MALIDREVRQNWPRLEEELYDDDDDDDYDYGYSTMEAQAEEAREEEERQNSLAAVFKSWLLIVGIFEMMLVFFQVSSSYYIKVLFKKKSTFTLSRVGRYCLLILLNF